MAQTAIMQMVLYFYWRVSFFIRYSSLVKSVFEVTSQPLKELIKNWAERQDLCIDGNQKSSNDDILWSWLNV